MYIFLLGDLYLIRKIIQNGFDFTPKNFRNIYESLLGRECFAQCNSCLTAAANRVFPPTTLCLVKSILTTPARLCVQSYPSSAVARYEVYEVSTSRLTKPLDYPRVKLRLLVGVVGCKHSDLGQSSADCFDYGDNPPPFLVLLRSWLIRLSGKIELW